MNRMKKLRHTNSRSKLLDGFDPCPGSFKPAVGGRCSKCWDLHPVYDSVVNRTYKLGKHKNTLKPHRVIEIKDPRQLRRQAINDNLCPNCETRKPTVTFIANGGIMDWIHGGGEQWCELCVVKVQLKSAKESKSDPDIGEKVKEVNKKCLAHIALTLLKLKLSSLTQTLIA